MPQNWYWVNLPHTWNAIDGQDGGNDYYRGTCFYAKEVQKEELPEGEQYYLEFLGVNASADVYVNGNHLDHHDGGYSTWRVNMTDALTDGKNLIVVAVDNSANDILAMSLPFQNGWLSEAFSTKSSVFNSALP